MTLNISVADDQLGAYFRKTAAIADRLGKSLPFEHVMGTLQSLHDGKVKLFGAGFRGRFVRIMPVMVGGILPADLVTAVKAIRELGSYAESMIMHPKFETLEMPEMHVQIELTPQVFGFTETPTTDEYLNADRLAEWSAANIENAVVELNHMSAGPHVALDYKDQPKGEGLWVASKPMLGRDDYSGVFNVYRRDGGGAWLSHDNAHPQYRWHLDYPTLFRLRELFSASAA